MFLVILLIFLGISKAIAVPTLSRCSGNRMCLPLSECKEVSDHDSPSSLFCGYFHQPYVCCDRDCQTPNGNYGKIVHVKNCNHLANINDADEKKRKFLLQSLLNDTHVCCNEGEDTYKTVPPAPLVSYKEKSLTDTCTSLNGEQARCVPIGSCEIFRKAVYGTDKEFRFVNESFCGWWKQPMVCCGSAYGYKESYKSNLPKECGLWDESLNETIPSWLAVIKHTTNDKNCIGTVINRDYVLTTIECTGMDYKHLHIKLGDCINNINAKNCTFLVETLKVFPVYQYLQAEDTGMVILKLKQPIQASPICLPQYDLALSEEVKITSLKRSGFKWSMQHFSTLTMDNTSCYAELKTYYERIICLKSKQVCREMKDRLVQGVVLLLQNNRWYLQGLFNKKACYGQAYEHFNAIYVYKFLQWIKSNIS